MEVFMDIKLNAEKNRAFFNQKIEEYDLVHESFMNTKNALTYNLPDTVTNILDLGAGTGLELIELFKRFPNVKVTAIDVSEKMLEKLRKREFGCNVKTICGNFFDVDFGSNYDAVISTSALHHFLKNDKLVLYKKIYDCLNPGGIFLNSDKIVNTNQEEIEAIEFYNKYINDKPHIDTPLSIEHEMEILKDALFEDVLYLPVEKENYRLFKSYKK